MEDPNSQQQIADRVLRLMPQTESELALVITGHLLIEERLQALLSTIARDPESLKNARLQFAQKLDLVRAFSFQTTHPHIWEFTTKLNSLRNKLAHNVELPGVASKIEELVKIIPDAYTRLPDPVGNSKSRLALCVSVV